MNDWLVLLVVMLAVIFSWWYGYWIGRLDEREISGSERDAYNAAFKSAIEASNAEWRKPSQPTPSQIEAVKKSEEQDRHRRGAVQLAKLNLK